jgi:hypothetical protein
VVVHRRPIPERAAAAALHARSGRRTPHRASRGRRTVWAASCWSRTSPLTARWGRAR